jgi:hypothetical protein
VALALKPGKPYRPLVPPASHPTKWRTTTTIPAHAPRLNATADQRMIVECQSISFMAPPPEQVPTGTFLASLPERAEHRKRHVTFSTAYPRVPQGGLGTSGIRCSGAKDRLRSNGVP